MMRGQEMAVFKLLIGAVFAVALLTIIHSAVSNIGCPYSSFEEVRSLVLQASKAPGKCFNRETVCFNDGSIIERKSLEANLPGISIYSITGIAKGLKCQSNYCTFEAKLNIPIKAECSQPDYCRVVLNSLC